MSKVEVKLTDTIRQWIRLSLNRPTEEIFPAIIQRLETKTTTKGTINEIKGNTNKEKGDLWEAFSQVYLEAILPEGSEVYPFLKVPKEHKDKLTLPSKDAGIDLIAVVPGKKTGVVFYNAIQCKYRHMTGKVSKFNPGGKTKITYSDLSTFIAATTVGTWKKRWLITNCDGGIWKNLRSGEAFTDGKCTTITVKRSKFMALSKETWIKMAGIVGHSLLPSPIESKIPLKETVTSSVTTGVPLSGVVPVKTSRISPPAHIRKKMEQDKKEAIRNHRAAYLGALAKPSSTITKVTTILVLLSIVVANANPDCWTPSASMDCSAYGVNTSEPMITDLIYFPVSGSGVIDSAKMAVSELQYRFDKMWIRTIPYHQLIFELVQPLCVPAMYTNQTEIALHSFGWGPLWLYLSKSICEPGIIELGFANSSSNIAVIMGRKLLNHLRKKGIPVPDIDKFTPPPHIKVGYYNATSAYDLSWTLTDIGQGQFMTFDVMKFRNSVYIATRDDEVDSPIFLIFGMACFIGMFCVGGLFFFYGGWKWFRLNVCCCMDQCGICWLTRIESVDRVSSRSSLRNTWMS